MDYLVQQLHICMSIITFYKGRDLTDEEFEIAQGIGQKIDEYIELINRSADITMMSEDDVIQKISDSELTIH